jgi:hypothetical protein
MSVVGKCPRCGIAFTHAAMFDGSQAAPAGPGDLVVCLSCAQILRAMEAGGFRELAAGEFESLPAQTQGDLVRTQLLVRAWRATFSRN